MRLHVDAEHVLRWSDLSEDGHVVHAAALDNGESHQVSDRARNSALINNLLPSPQGCLIPLSFLCGIGAFILTPPSLSCACLSQ